MGIYNLEDAMEKCSPFATDVPFVEVKYDKCGNVVSKTAHNMENLSIPEFEQKQLCLDQEISYGKSIINLSAVNA